MEFDRHLTALHRHHLSRPVRHLVSDGLLSANECLFDYGCGRGSDVRLLTDMGFECAGWDPVHSPDTAPRPADVVNLGYVVNVVESLGERADVLKRAWALARKRLVVSARLSGELSDTKAVSEFADGVVTQRGTFQKFYEQGELKSWIEATLAVSPVAAAPGIFYVFRDEADRTLFLAARYRRAPKHTRLSRLDELVAGHQELFDSLSLFVADRGRPPGPEEWTDYERFLRAIGTMERGMRALRNAVPADNLEAARRARTEDLLLFIALSRFDGRPDFHRLHLSVQRDVKAFFGTYKRACAEADRVLMTMGEGAARDAELAASKIGKLLPNALYLHISALPAASLTLRLYEGCARNYLGAIENSNILKFARGEPRVSFLTYPTFDKDPHPALAASTSVRLQTFQIRDRRYDSWSNPPILHRKETFLEPGHPSYAKFARLTLQEERHGLYENPSRIGTREGWQAVLAEKGLTLAGHRVVTQKT